MAQNHSSHKCVIVNANIINVFGLILKVVVSSDPTYPLNQTLNVQQQYDEELHFGTKHALCSTTEAWQTFMQSADNRCKYTHNIYTTRLQ